MENTTMMSLRSLQATAIHYMLVAFLTALSYSNECVISTSISATTALKIEPNEVFMGVISLKVGRVSWV